MRIVKELTHPQMKITIFNWNGKYLLKFEQDDLEQTFKVDELDLTGENDLDEIMNEEFLSDIIRRFREMSLSFSDRLSQI